MLALKIATRCLNDLILSSLKLNARTLSNVQSTFKTKVFGNDFDELTSNEYRKGKRVAVNKLQELLNVREFMALDLVNKHKKLYMVPGKWISENFAICKKYDVDGSSILKHPEILVQKGLEVKMLLLKKLPFTINTTCSLLNLEFIVLDIFVQKQLLECQSIPGGRIKVLAELFEVTEEYVCECLVKMKFLRSVDLEKLKVSYKLIRSHGVEKAEINKDLWVLRCSTEVINQRLSFAKTHNVGKIKTWMVRATHEILDNYIQRITDNKQVLGNHSLVEYLSEKLDCTVDEARDLVLKLPALKNKSMKKMQEIIDFLFTKDFRPNHIYRVPKILLHSVETMKKRLKELESKDFKIDSLYMLTKSQRQYKQYYEALIKSNKKAKT